MTCTIQAGRYFNQDDYDQQTKKRAEQCIEQINDDEHDEILRTEQMHRLRDEFMTSSNKKYTKARLMDSVNANVKLHHFSLEERRHK